jgi:transposase-like protein
MYDDEVRAVARAAITSGESLNSISKRFGVIRTPTTKPARHTAHAARTGSFPARTTGICSASI